MCSVIQKQKTKQNNTNKKKKGVPTCGTRAVNEPSHSRKTWPQLGKKLLNTLKKENKSLFRAFPYFFWFVAHWVIGDVTLVCLCLKGDVCV